MTSRDILPDAEQNRNKRRDKKRRTAMVVDGAGIRRIAQAIARRVKDVKSTRNS